MSSLSLFKFDNEEIRFKNLDGRVWVSLTDMAKASNKRVNDWNRLAGTIELLEGLESIAGFPVMESKVGGTPETTGTWAIEEIAIEFAGWCKVSFKIWMIQKIKELLSNGKVELNKEPLAVALPPGDIRVTNLIGSLTALGIELTNPRIKQGLQDLTLDLLGLTKSLPSSVPIDIWAGVAERAEELGYTPGLVVQYRSQLGKYVKSFSLESKQEKRLCNGTQRPINIYRVSNDLDNAIKEFMDAKVLAS